MKQDSPAQAATRNPSYNRGRGRPTGRRTGSSSAVGRTADRPPDAILWQNYFKSVGPRTYAAQLKKAGNGNHYLVLTEGKRNDQTGEVRKSRLYIYSEDFAAFFHLLRETAETIRANPVPKELVEKRQRFWAKQRSKPASSSSASDRTGGRSPAAAGVSSPGG